MSQSPEVTEYALMDVRSGELIEVAEPARRVMTFPTWGDALHYARPQVDAAGNRTLEVVEYRPVGEGSK